VGREIEMFDEFVFMFFYIKESIRAWFVRKVVPVGHKKKELI
jgi:hypothetical protein